MAYTPPATNAVNFTLETYNAPATNAVNFDLLDIGSSSESPSESPSLSPSSSISPSISPSVSPSVSPSGSIDRYWVGGAGDWSDATNHWATSNGGSPGADNFPDETNNVYVTSSSGFGAGGTITLDVAGECNDFTSTSGHTITISDDNSLKCYGDIILENNLTIIDLGYYGSGTNTLTVNGAEVGTFHHEGTGTLTLQDNFVISSNFSQINGTFDANDHNITASTFYFYADTGYTPTVVMGSGIWEATGNETDDADDRWLVREENSEVVTITRETSTIKLTGTGSGKKTFNGSGKTYYNVWFTGSETEHIAIYGSNTFNNFKIDNPPHTVYLPENSTQTVSSWTVSGTSGNLITLDKAHFSSFWLTNTDDYIAAGQSFTGEGQTLTSAQFYLSKYGSPTGNAYAKIYAHSGTFGTSSVPTGAALATSDALDVSTLTTTTTKKSLSFSGGNQITLTDETNYVLTIEYDNGDFDNALRVFTSLEDIPTRTGNASAYANPSWGASGDNDLDIGINDVLSQFNISKSSGTVTSDYLDLSSSNATGGATWYAGIHSNNTTNNTGWIFTGTPSPSVSPSVSPSESPSLSPSSSISPSESPSISPSISPSSSQSPSESSSQSPSLSSSSSISPSSSPSQSPSQSPSASPSISPSLSPSSSQSPSSSPSQSPSLSPSSSASPSVSPSVSPSLSPSSSISPSQSPSVSPSLSPSSSISPSASPSQSPSLSPSSSQSPSESPSASPSISPSSSQSPSQSPSVSPSSSPSQSPSLSPSSSQSPSVSPSASPSLSPSSSISPSNSPSQSPSQSPGKAHRLAQVVARVLAVVLVILLASPHHLVLVYHHQLALLQAHL